MPFPNRTRLISLERYPIVNLLEAPPELETLDSDLQWWWENLLSRMTCWAHVNSLWVLCHQLSNTFRWGAQSFPLHRWRKWVWGWHSLLLITQEWTPISGDPEPKSSLCCIPEARVAVYTEGIHCVSPPPLSSRCFCLALLPTPSLIETGPVNCYLSLLTIGVHTSF